ncbi:unnamed protein product [Kluyveromyces dobzhanskii CBS 2104]|uniref:glucan endo-1,3-beta-D-glucosidase n=1 Tax=Kluyveromyces dobzhanskii CBS 2104 TaxID=1427455 RepID=A0A0A8LC89_9SACH|nr:unnamed protein product [Kluyveromyces dobzhanskii CBS 2104]
MLRQLSVLALVFVASAQVSADDTESSKTRTLLPTAFSGIDPIAYETDIVYVNPEVTTFTVGEVYQNAASSSVISSAVSSLISSSKPTRVSATSVQVTSLGNSSIILSLADESTAVPVVSETSDISQQPAATTDASDLSATSAVSAVSEDSQFSATSDVSEGSQFSSTSGISSTSSTSEVPYFPGNSSSVSASSEIPVTEKYTETKSTSTSVIYSTSSTIEPSITKGTTVTTIESKSQPLVTQSMVSSDQLVTIATSTISSDQTLSPTGITGTTTTSQSTQLSTVTSTVLSSSYSMISSSYGNTTVLSYSAVPVNYTTTQKITSTSVAQVSTAVLTDSSTVVDLFAAVATSEPLSVFERVANPLSLAAGVDNGALPYQTNKFYGNLIVGSQLSSAFVYPYVLFKTSQGIAIQHTSSSQYSFSDTNSLINPLNIASLVVSSTEFQSDSMNLKVSEMYHGSCNVKMVSTQDASNYIETPLVQGMGFVTSVFNGDLTPFITSGVGFSTLTQESSDNLADGIMKYRVTLFNNVDWLVYVIVPDSSSTDDVSLAINNGNIVFSIADGIPTDGLIVQIAEAPTESNSETYYDSAAGMYFTNMELAGTSDGNTASYKFVYDTEGKSASGASMIFALPHHLKSLTATTNAANTGIRIDSTTKGKMSGFLTTSLEFQTQLNANVNWLPWSEQKGDDALVYTSAQLQLLAEVANEELQVNIKSSVEGLNTYYIGKVLDKYAFILLTLSDIVQDETVTLQTLTLMKEAFAMLTANQQLYPLDYDTTYGGIISSGDLGSTATQYDFGNTYYNDHHFHYGYIIHAAAVIAHVDQKYAAGDWVATNKDWVSALIRDVCNPSLDDSYFPQFRMFDWFHGHSWAAGLFENGNGKNEESSSEDYHFAYGMKLWGEVTENDSMNRLGSLMLNVLRDSMQDYFYYEDSNTVEPGQTVSNKVSGILFDNIIDYTTYFGVNTEYIHGIHMLPLTPASGLIRSTKFVEQEWEQKLAPIIDDLQSGWAGILRLNEALYDPATSYAFFAQDDFQTSLYLDNGMSRTWALAFAGGLQ